MAQDSGETLEVTLTPEDQMVLKYLVKLMMQGVSRDEVALAFDHAFVDVRETEVAALRRLVQRENRLSDLDVALSGGRFETLHMSLANGDLINCWRGADSR
ncbi:MAG: hypothetical protein ACYTGX_08085 [Planctomycetota bacterium]|jgi:hypothetical protein